MNTRSTVKKFFFISLLLIISVSLCSCGEEELKYLLQQAPGQFALLLNRVPIEKMLRRKDLDPELRRKLTLVLDVKKYAVEQIGLYQSKNYEIYKEIDHDAVVYSLTACPPLSMKNLTWKFPYVGEVPYLGFFNKDNGLLKQGELDAQGYDTYLRTAGAYSMLGIVSDPLYSPLLKMRDAELSNLIIHEMTHSTVWVEGSVDFNENLALFVGNQGSINYQLQKGGPDSPEVKYALAEDHDDKVFSDYLMGLYNDLDSLYKSNLPDDEKRGRKQEIIIDSKAKFRDQVLPQMWGDRYAHFAEREYNNAMIISRTMYFKDLTLYKNIYHAHNDDLKVTVDFFKEVEKAGGNPEQYCREWLSKQGK